MYSQIGIYSSQHSDREKYMKELKDRIRTQGKYLGKGILKVDGFINHQVDPMLMKSCGRSLASKFSNVGATKISRRIINEVRGVNRVVYDISTKP